MIRVTGTKSEYPEHCPRRASARERRKTPEKSPLVELVAVVLELQLEKPAPAFAAKPKMHDCVQTEHSCMQKREAPEGFGRRPAEFHAAGHESQ